MIKIAQLKLENLNIMYDDFHAVKDVNIEVEESEIVTLLGPSGCGKTSILRSIAGFVNPSEGKIIVGGEDITNKPPQKRDMGMIFQNYALWPHMKVEGNIGYGLQLRGLEDEKRKQKVSDLLAQVQLSDQADKLPTQLSGGQQQRVALARALAIEPKVLLCDEPLSNLDFKLRVELRKEIRDIAKNFGVTVVYVTHDQTEALAISDKIAVINKGVIIQIGTPLEIFNDPDTHFVARFVGENNLLEGKVDSVGTDHVMVKLSSGDVCKVNNVSEKLEVGTDIDVIIRYDQISIVDGTDVSIESSMKYKAYMGNYLQIELDLGDGTIVSANIEKNIAEVSNMPRDTKLNLHFNPDKIFLFSKDDGKRIR